MKNYSILLLIVALIFSVVEVDAQRRGKRTKKVDIPLEGTTFHIRNVKGGKYIDLPGSDKSDRSRKNGANVQLWDLDDGDDRKFKFIPAGGGYYYIQAQHKKMNLDVHGCFDDKWFCDTYKKDKGANVQVWSAGSSKPQQWKLEQASKGRFYIKNRYSGKYLDASNSNVNKNGCNVMQWNKDSNTNKQWELVDVKSGRKYSR
ncbi:MAG: RICIN domain-containing protein [Bacteroidota bacterium]